MKEAVYRDLAKIKDVKIWYYPELHAKCYYNEDKMIITSMNLFKYSQANNREMGILLEREKYPDVFSKAVRETNSIKKHSSDRTPKKATSSNQPTYQKSYSKPPYKKPISKPKKQEKKSFLGSIADAILKEPGYCIRCGTDIDNDPNRPFCNKCYRSWSNFGDENYKEKVCHSCGGKKRYISKARPECKTCWSETH
jgi:hypothetical protein